MPVASLRRPNIHRAPCSPSICRNRHFQESLDPLLQTHAVSQVALRILANPLHGARANRLLRLPRGVELQLAVASVLVVSMFAFARAQTAPLIAKRWRATCTSTFSWRDKRRAVRSCSWSHSDSNGRASNTARLRSSADAHFQQRPEPSRSWP